LFCPLSLAHTPLLLFFSILHPSLPA
jgi:hypothetical protein